MKNRILALLMAMVTVVSMTGCGGEAKSAKVEAPATNVTQETAETEETENTEELTLAQNEKKITKDAEDNLEHEDLGMLLGSKGVNAKDVEEDDFDKMFEETSLETGYVGNDAEEFAAVLEDYDCRVEELSLDALGETVYDDSVLYHFTMYNEDAPMELESDGGSVYATEMLYDDDVYCVIFGTNLESSYAEAEVYCEPGTTVEYWAVGVKESGYGLLLPIFAGTEEAGYYAVRPALAALGMDVSEMKTLEEQGIDFNTEESEIEESELTEASETEDPQVDEKADSNHATALSEDVLELKMGEVEYFTNSVTLNYTLTNNGTFDAYLDDEVVLLNGVDITDDCVLFVMVEAGKTIEDAFYIDNHELSEGDVIEINGTLLDNDDYKEKGTVTFTITLQ